MASQWQLVGSYFKNTHTSVFPPITGLTVRAIASPLKNYAAVTHSHNCPNSLTLRHCFSLVDGFRSGPRKLNFLCLSALTPELRTTLDKVVASQKVLLFMKGTKEFPQCGFSHTVVQILTSLNVPFETINILENDLLRQALKEYSSWPTFPQLYINGEFFGGCDITVVKLHLWHLNPNCVSNYSGLDLSHRLPKNLCVCCPFLWTCWKEILGSLIEDT